MTVNEDDQHLKRIRKRLETLAHRKGLAKKCKLENSPRHKEYFYVSGRLGLEGADGPHLDGLLVHIHQFLKGDRTVPVFQAENHMAHRAVTFTLSAETYMRLLEERTSSYVWKAVISALKHGFRGHSKGGRSGIFYQRSRDRKMSSATWTLANACRNEVKEDLLVDDQEYAKLRPIKIVCHNPGGTRVVGLAREDLERAIFVGEAHY